MSQRSFLLLITLCFLPNTAARASSATLLPGGECTLQLWNPQYCSDRRLLVEALTREDFRLANRIVRTQNFAQKRNGAADDNIYNAATLGLPVILGLPEAFDFLSSRVDLNLPTFVHAPVFASQTAFLKQESDERLGFDFMVRDLTIPPLLLTILFDRKDMFRRLLEFRSGLNRDAVDSLGNNVWHYIAYFGRVDYARHVRLSPARFRKNKQGLTPLEILGKSQRLSKANRERLEAYFQGVITSLQFQ